MRELGVYIKEPVSANDTIIERNTFVWYRIVRRLEPRMIYDAIYDVEIWSLKGGYPDGRKPDVKFKTINPHLIENTVIPIKAVADKYYIEWGDRTWRIRECMTFYDYGHDYERIKTLKLDIIGSNYCHLSWEGERAMLTLKYATVTPIYKKHKLTLADFYPFDHTAVGDTINEELKKTVEQSAMKYTLNSFYGIGGFTTNPEPFKVVKIAEKETKTMEKKKMTVTDSFLKHINGITITSTYSKLDSGEFGNPYYIYYPEMEITEDMADTLLTVLLMAKREFIHKVVFNPEKGTTIIYRNNVESITVKCRDGEFDYILGYEMAKSKMYLGSDDYNWFNKIKNHRKTHIEYTEKPTEPKAKRASKKGGKK